MAEREGTEVEAVSHEMVAEALGVWDNTRMAGKLAGWADRLQRASRQERPPERMEDLIREGRMHAGDDVEERPPGGREALTREQARRIEDVLEELDVDQRSWSKVERDALAALERLANSEQPGLGDLQLTAADHRELLGLVQQELGATDEDSMWFDPDDFEKLKALDSKLRRLASVSPSTGEQDG